MKYSWEFKLECVKNYKIGKSNVNQNMQNVTRKNFLIK